MEHDPENACLRFDRGGYRQKSHHALAHRTGSHSMIHRPTRRDIVTATALLAAAGGCSPPRAAPARDAPPKFSGVDAILRAATSAGEIPGVVAMAATREGIVYEGVFGKRQLPD